MKYDIPSALQELKPGAEWVLRGNDYSGLEWMDSSQTKPTETEVTNKIAALDAAEAMKLLRVERDTRIASISHELLLLWNKFNFPCITLKSVNRKVKSVIQKYDRYLKFPTQESFKEFLMCLI